MKSIGYARSASTTGNLDSQVEALRTAGCDPIFRETASGMSGQQPELEKAMAALSQGDELVIVDLARLGRDTAALQQTIEAVRKHGATLRSLAGDLPD